MAKQPVYLLFFIKLLLLYVMVILDDISTLSIKRVIA